MDLMDSASIRHAREELEHLLARLSAEDIYHKRLTAALAKRDWIPDLSDMLYDALVWSMDMKAKYKSDRDGTRHR